MQDKNAVKDPKFGRGWRKAIILNMSSSRMRFFLDGAKCEYYKENRE